MSSEKNNVNTTEDLSNMLLGEDLIDFDEKKFFLKLRKNYLRISGIKHREELQGKLYDGFTKVQIIKFELNRIILSSSSFKEFSEQILMINKLLELYSDSMSDDLYKKIINIIIKIEIESNMRVALFSELCEMYEEYQEKIENMLRAKVNSNRSKK